MMHCVICKQDETRPGTATVTLERDGATVVMKQVPAMVCDNCGEYYLDEAMTERVLAMGEQAGSQGAEIETSEYWFPSSAWEPGPAPLPDRREAELRGQHSQAELGNE
jgi:YgiT-type zinc finger domain-containing protein